MSREGMARFANALRTLHEGTKALAHVLGNMQEEAEREVINQDFMMKAAQAADQMDLFNRRIISSMAVPKDLLDPEAAKKEKEKIFIEMLAQSGLPAWLEELQNVVDSLRPDNDLLTFKKQVEALVNDKRVRRIGARLFRAENSGEGHEGLPQADHHR